MKKQMLLAVLTATVSAFAVIAVAEAQDVVKEEGVKPPKHERKFKFDKDGDKKMSKQEYIDMHLEKFAKMDANSDGFITREEMHEARKNARKHFRKHHGEKEEKGFFAKLFGKGGKDDKDCKRMPPPPPPHDGMEPNAPPAE